MLMNDKHCEIVLVSPPEHRGHLVFWCELFVGVHENISETRASSNRNTKTDPLSTVCLFIDSQRIEFNNTTTHTTNLVFIFKQMKEKVFTFESTIYTRKNKTEKNSQKNTRWVFLPVLLSHRPVSHGKSLSVHTGRKKMGGRK
eukprot:TRINITY_DN2339_c0_g4_i2.p1 TRINITY_DN2339_c0_g4~~TRINITY_DN2339_c0_g4_i2.p1  ORF type:complete len:143 (-),score=22.73 TRINITY_DN2339_c0_g4_i2:180-608(-)